MTTTESFRDIYLMRVEAPAFREAYEYARETDQRVMDATSPFSHDGHDETFYYLTADGRSGFCVRHDGELVFVFSTVRGRGEYLVRAAIDRGADHLDCFDGYLTQFYGRLGFVETRREPNWTPGGPDVVWMAFV